MATGVFGLEKLQLVVDHTANQMAAAPHQGDSSGEGSQCGANADTDQTLLGEARGALAGGFGIEHDEEAQENRSGWRVLPLLSSSRSDQP